MGGDLGEPIQSNISSLPWEKILRTSHLSKGPNEALLPVKQTMSLYLDMGIYGTK